VGRAAGRPAQVEVAADCGVHFGARHAEAERDVVERDVFDAAFRVAIENDAVLCVAAQVGEMHAAHNAGIAAGLSDGHVEGLSLAPPVAGEQEGVDGEIENRTLAVSAAALEDADAAVGG
jgi:hypothetical protein